MNRASSIAGAALLASTGAIHLDLYVTGCKSMPTIGWLFLLQVIAAFGLAVIVAVSGSLAGRRRRPVRAVHPRRHAATSRLTGRTVCGRVGCRAYRRQRRDVALGWQCAGQGTSASVCPQTPAHGFLTGPDRAGMLGPGQCRARESSQCGRPVPGRSVAGPSGPGRAEQPRRIPAAAPLLAAGVTLGVHMSAYVTAGTGPAIRSCAIGDESAVRERCEFSHRPAGPLCSSSSQMTLRGLALCGCS